MWIWFHARHFNLELFQAMTGMPGMGPVQPGVGQQAAAPRAQAESAADFTEQVSLTINWNFYPYT